jgi:hypothetical protein
MGFDRHDLEALKHPQSVSVLTHSTMLWCDPKVKPTLVKQLLFRGSEISGDMDRIDRMLRSGASTEMMTKYLGLTNQEVALRRSVLGLDERRGRYPNLSEEQLRALWGHWRTLVSDRRVSPNDDDAMMTIAIELAERLKLPAASIWSAIRYWIDNRQV